MFKIDPIIVLEEKVRNRRAGRLAALMVIQEDQRKQSEKMKSKLPGK